MGERSGPNTETGRDARNAPWYIKAFVVFHIIAITIWALPNPPEAYATGNLKLGIDPNGPGGTVGSLARLLTDAPLVWKSDTGRPSFFKYYTLGTGFWQYWDMFSPNPIDYDIYCTADVHFTDGTAMVYHYPRMYDLDVFRKYLGERYRKFFERASGMPFLWPAFSRHIAEICEAQSKKPVYGLKLWLHKAMVPPPDRPLIEGYSNYDFYESTHTGGKWRYFEHRSGKWYEVYDRSL